MFMIAIFLTRQKVDALRRADQSFDPELHQSFDAELTDLENLLALRVK